MLSEMLNPNEALFLWHFPAPGQEDQKIHLILVWRDESPNGVKRARRRWRIKEWKEKGKWNSETDFEWVHTKDIVNGSMQKRGHTWPTRNTDTQLLKGSAPGLSS